MFEAGFWPAMLLTTFAGLSTGLGSMIAFFSKQTNLRFLSWATGFSGGVMLYVSFVEILPKGVAAMEAVRPENDAELIATIALFGGMIFSFIIDQVIPHADNPHESRTDQELACVGDLCRSRTKRSAPWRIWSGRGFHRTLAVGIPTFPRGW